MTLKKSDELWLDEYAKRHTMFNIYGASSMAFSWSLYAKLVSMALEKSAGKEVDFHPGRTPALIAGLTGIGTILTYLLYDQMSATERLDAQRLAKRVGFNNQESKTDERKYAQLPSRVSMRHVLMPGGTTLTARISKTTQEERRFEKTWYRKFIIRRMKGDFFGALQYGSLFAMLPFALRAALAKGNGDKPTFRHPQTTLVMLSLVPLGFFAQYQLARYISGARLLTDNYQAREIAMSKGEEHEGVSDLSTLFTDEKGEEQDNPFHAYDRKWLKENTSSRAKWFAMNTLTTTIFYGVIHTAASMMLDKAAGKEVKFRPYQSSAIFASALAAGGLTAYLCSLAEAHVRKQEDDRLAIRITGQKPDMDGNVEEPKAKTGNSNDGQGKMTKKADEDKDAPALHDDIEPPEDFEAYDKEWLKRFQQLSFQKGLYNAFAGATFFGMFSILTGMLIDKVGNPEKEVNFRLPYSPMLMAGMSAVGVYFAYLSNVKESLLRKLEDDRLAHRIKAGDDPEAENGKNADDTMKAQAGDQLAPFIAPLPKWQRRIIEERKQREGVREKEMAL